MATGRAGGSRAEPGGPGGGSAAGPGGSVGALGSCWALPGLPAGGGPPPTRPDGGSRAAVWAKPPRTRTPTLFPPGELSLSFAKISPASFPASKFNRGQKPIAGVRAGRELNGREGRLTWCSGLELHAG